MKKKSKVSQVKPTAAKKPQQSNLLKRVIYFLPALLITFLPLIITRDHWSRVWYGGFPRAWDGTGHYAVAQIYADTIFPDTFGWIDNFFAGMPFPNFYPPLFYWLTALLSKVGMFSFLTSFKIMVSLPIILIPLVFWLMSWSITGGSRAIASLSALICVWLLVDYRFASAAFPLGLDYFSTFQIGLYTQPLGFLFLLIWVTLYCVEVKGLRTVAQCSLILALVILSNFFGAVIAIIFIVAVSVTDLLSFWTKKESGRKDITLLIYRLMVPLLALLLSAFCLVPMFNGYDYFVTRPSLVSITPTFFTFFLYLLGGFGILVSVKKKASWNWYNLACLILAAVIFLLPTLAPSWFPFQTNRFLANFNFLLCLPAGITVEYTIKQITKILSNKYNLIESFVGQMTFLLILLLLSLLCVRNVKYELAFYTQNEFARIEPVLQFGKNNATGLYLVENPDPRYPAAQLDGRAINAYLGLQGNLTANVVFREASPMSVFFNPLQSAFSAYPENYGLSSVLADDLDFIEQPISKHIERARFLGIKYFVNVSPKTKEQLRNAGLKENNLGAWSIFEIPQEVLPQTQSLPFKPALFVGGFSLKERRSDQIDFVRLAEEQFSDGWFDVLLSFEPQNISLEQTESLESFSVLIVGEHEYRNEDAAYNNLKAFSRSRLVIIIDNGNHFVRRIKDNAKEFDKLLVIDYKEDNFHRLINEFASYRYNQSKIRATWRTIRQHLESNKIQSQSAPNVFQKRTFHPNWNKDSTGYVVTPFFSMIQSHKSAETAFRRKFSERFAVLLSSAFFIICLPFLLGSYSTRSLKGCKTTA